MSALVLGLVEEQGQHMEETEEILVQTMQYIVFKDDIRFRFHFSLKFTATIHERNKRALFICLKELFRRQLSLFF